MANVSAVKSNESDAPRLPRDLITIAESAVSRKDWAGAIAGWSDCIATFSDNIRPNWMMGLADAQLESGDPAAASKTFSKGAKKFPHNPGLHVGKARTAMALQDWPAVATYWQACIDNFKDNVQPHWLSGLGAAQLRCGKLDDAEQTYKLTVEKFPSARPGYVGLARVAGDRQDWDTCAKRWEVADTQFPQPSFPETGASWARALRACGRFDDADQVLNKFLEVHKDSATLLIGLALNATATRDAEQRVLRWKEVENKFPTEVVGNSQYQGFLIDQQTGEGVVRSFGEIFDADEPAATEQLNILSSHRLSLDFTELARVYSLKFPQSDRIRAKFLRAFSRNLTSAADLENLLQEAESFCDDHPNCRQAWIEKVNALICADKADEVEEVLKYISEEYGRGSDTDGFRAWLFAQRGDYETARLLTEKVHSNDYIPSLDSEIHNMDRVDSNEMAEINDQIVLFSTIRNEMDFLPWFFDYYRGIGVNRFVIIDNGSDDGSTEYAAQQNDAIVYRTDDNFFAAASGMRWINEMISRHGQENWCIFVDLDEQLMVPGIEENGLRPVLDGMRERDETILKAYMLDTYPDNLSELEPLKAGVQPINVSPFFDPEHFFFGSPEAPYAQVRGGMRSRMFDLAEVLEKAPIVWGGVGTRYLGNHSLTPGKISAVSGVVLHHKMLRDGYAIRKTENLSGNARLKDRNPSCQRRYLRYRDVFNESEVGASLKSPSSVEYTSSAQLIEMGLMADRSSGAS